MLGWSGSNSPCRAAWTGRLSNPCLRIGWIEEAQNLIIEGPASVGKSWLACALGHKACRDNRSVLYQRAPRMFGDLALARGDGRYPRLMRSAASSFSSSMIGGWSPLGPEQRHDML